MFKELVHKADLGNGYYMNPILDGDYADPAVMRDGDKYYLCVSTGFFKPGLTIFESSDLVNWQVLCYPLKDFELKPYAPDIYKYKDLYYIYFCGNDSNFVITSKKIDGEWSEPVDLKIGHLDPGHCFDLDGKRLLLLSDNYMVELTDDGLSCRGEFKQFLKAPKLPDEWDIEGAFPEAPNVFKKGEYYYLTYADGGTTGPATSHMIMSARTKDPRGKWEMSPYNPIIHTYNKTDKWISKGHGHFVDDIDGNWWVIYHAYENGCYTAGRKLMLSPVVFTDDGWFKVEKPCDEATLKPRGKKTDIEQSFSDEFNKVCEMPVQWQSYGAIEKARIKRTENGLYFSGKNSEIGESNPLVINTGDKSFEITTSITLDNCSAGLVYIYNEKIYNAVVFDGEFLKIFRMGKLLAKQELKTKQCSFKLKVNNGYLSFYYAIENEKFKKLNYVINTTYQNAIAYNGFGSLRPGIFAVGDGKAKFDYFKYIGLQ